MPKKDFKIAIMHGRAKEYQKISSLINKLEFTPIVIKDNFTGDFLLKKVRKTVWKDAHCAIIVMTPDDELKNSIQRSRQNVIFELGYCIAAFDTLPNKYWYNAVIIVKETSVEDFSDIHGMEVFNFSKRLSLADLEELSDIIVNT